VLPCVRLRARAFARHRLGVDLFGTAPNQSEEANMPGNPDRLALSRKLADPNISDAELAAHFEVDPHKSKPFRPRFRLRPETAARLHPDDAMVAGSLSMSDYFAQQRQRAYREKIANGWTGLRLVSEGDSWFQYPIVLQDIIDDLFDEYAIYDMSAAGDTLHNIGRGISDVIGVLNAEKSSGLLLSGGGNDFLDRDVFSHVLRGFDPSFHSAAEYVIAHRVAERMQSIQADYIAIFEAVMQRAAGVKIFCHGYDWAIPRFGGPYLWPVMDEKEIPDPLRPEITKILVDAFNDLMRTLAAGPKFTGVVTYIDCRGAVGSNTGAWHDEIHPLDPGFARIADRFRQAINRLLVA
jgi:hypothetical protein